jgi:O-methyltransferase involved in polyketide biosynthesis
VSTAGGLDTDRPVVLLACAVLRFLPDTDYPTVILAADRSHLVAGSWLVIFHSTADQRSSAEVQAGVDTYRDSATPVTPRTRTQVADLFDGCPLVEPGLVWAPHWRPEPGTESADVPERSNTWAGMAQLP